MPEQYGVKIVRMNEEVYLTIEKNCGIKPSAVIVDTGDSEPTCLIAPGVDGPPEQPDNITPPGCRVVNKGGVCRICCYDNLGNETWCSTFTVPCP